MITYPKSHISSVFNNNQRPHFSLLQARLLLWKTYPEGLNSKTSYGSTPLFLAIGSDLGKIVDRDDLDGEATFFLNLLQG